MTGGRGFTRAAQAEPESGVHREDPRHLASQTKGPALRETSKGRLCVSEGGRAIARVEVCPAAQAEERPCLHGVGFVGGEALDAFEQLVDAPVKAADAVAQSQVCPRALLEAGLCPFVTERHQLPGDRLRLVDIADLARMANPSDQEQDVVERVRPALQRYSGDTQDLLRQARLAARNI